MAATLGKVEEAAAAVPSPVLSMLNSKSGERAVARVAVTNEQHNGAWTKLGGQPLMRHEQHACTGT